MSLIEIWPFQSPRTPSPPPKKDDDKICVTNGSIGREQPIADLRGRRSERPLLSLRFAIEMAAYSKKILIALKGGCSLFLLDQNTKQPQLGINFGTKLQQDAERGVLHWGVSFYLKNGSDCNT